MPEFDINHWNIKGYRQQMTAKELRAAIKQHGDNIIRWGEILYLKSIRLGAGMYNVWFEADPKRLQDFKPESTK